MSKTHIPGRPTLYKGIQMRSRLEADFAAFLDRAGADWDYEPVCFAGPDGQWLPDFRLRHDGPTIYFELKPMSMLDDEDAEIDPILERMSVVWLTEPDAVLHLAFWTYGEPQKAYSFVGMTPDDEDDWTWWCGDGIAPERMMIWVGMGQLLRMCEKVEAEEKAAAARDTSMILSEICRDEHGITALVSAGEAITACGITPEKVWWCECGIRISSADRHVGPGDVCEHLRMVGSAPTEAAS